MPLHLFPLLSHMPGPETSPHSGLGLERAQGTRIKNDFTSHPSLLTLLCLIQPPYGEQFLVWDRDYFKCVVSQASLSKPAHKPQQREWREWPGKVCAQSDLTLAQFKGDLEGMREREAWGQLSGMGALLYKEHEMHALDSSRTLDGES